MKKCSDQFVVGGMQPFTMIDFPGKIATVLFAQGCNLRCRFCYNQSLLPAESRETLGWQSIIEFLRDRQGFVEGVVFSGGEPCMQPALLAALAKVKELGFATALHTNGYYPGIVHQALQHELIDAIAIDVKGALRNYKAITGSAADENNFSALISSIVASGIEHEFRTTVHSKIVSETEILQLARWLSGAGVKKYVLQKFQFGQALDVSLEASAGIGLAESSIIKIRDMFSHFEIRGDQGLDYLKKAA
jgi:anaerobic ribonucleoside-triphosphate reductase activating protein